ncbi:hypothetical protein L7F22_056959 [Adiantum nelumboides]|nr:hypothetical protein [Adiantum nelumboides]
MLVHTHAHAHMCHSMDLDDDHAEPDPHERVPAPADNYGSIFDMLFQEQQSYVAQQQAAAASALLSRYLIDCADLEVGECIGEGSSGIVYKGLHKGHIKVAVKELKGALTLGSKTQGEFRREVLSLMALCMHKHVVQLFGICLSSAHAICIVTKFMEGGSLLQHLVRKRSLPTKEIIKFAKDVAKGMHFLHSRGIIHMDLKTANVFLDEDGHAVIGDLGVARLVNEKEGGGMEIGTYRWMAPEVCSRAVSGLRGGSTSWFSYKTDVYSFGILLWELVTCKLPYVDYNPVQAAVGVVMHGLRPSIPSSTFPPLRYLIQKCWDQNPTNRPHFSEILQMLGIISLHEKNLKT